jgi:hypothetical protein
MKWVLRFPYLNDVNSIGVNTIAASKDVVTSIIRETTGLTGQDIGDMKIIIIDKWDATVATPTGSILAMLIIATVDYSIKKKQKLTIESDP